jgi:hypothetical protein
MLALVVAWTKAAWPRIYCPLSSAPLTVKALIAKPSLITI